MIDFLNMDLDALRREAEQAPTSPPQDWDVLVLDRWLLMGDRVTWVWHPKTNTRFCREAT